MRTGCKKKIQKLSKIANREKTIEKKETVAPEILLELEEKTKKLKDIETMISLLFRDEPPAAIHNEVFDEYTLHGVQDLFRSPVNSPRPN